MSEIQIYSEGLQLVINVDGVRIAMNINAAEQLRTALSEAVPLLRKEHEVALASHRGLMALLDLAKSKWDPQFDSHLAQACDILTKGQVQDAFERLESVSGTEMAQNGFASILSIQSDGWMRPRPSLSAEILIGLSDLAAQMPSDSVLNQLWNAHAWDRALLLACESILPSDLSANIQERLRTVVQSMQEMNAGRFVMGAEGADAWPFEGPIHEVTLSQTVHVMRYPVTQLLYWMVTGHNPSHHQGASRPVEQVSWLDACLFCNALSLESGFEAVYIFDDDSSVHWDPNRTGYRLPTEAEWECAAQGSQSGLFAGGDPADVAWYVKNSGVQTHAVGQLKANGFGLYDVCGNVWEWCWDGYDADFYSHDAAAFDPVGSLHCSEHVCRGGSFLDEAKSLRVSLRGRFDLTTAWSALGFRLVFQKPYRHWEQKESSKVLIGQEDA